MEHRLPCKLAAILYADVAGYSRLTGEDEDGTHRLLRRHLILISSTIEAHHGRVVHYAGDAVLADFGTVIEIIVPVSFHPGGDWRLFAGPGYELSETKDHALIRFGVGYEIPVGNRWTLAPEAIADFIDGGKEVYLLGLAIGRDS